MSARDLSTLASLAQQDPALLDRLRAADSVTAVVHIAADLSLTVTPEDFDPSELTDADLDGVTGGFPALSDLLMCPTSALWLWCR